MLEQASRAWEGQHTGSPQLGVIDNIFARTWSVLRIAKAAVIEVPASDYEPFYVRLT